MLTHQGISFWIEDSGGRPLNHSDPIVDVDTGKIMADIEIERNTHYCTRVRCTAVDEPMSAQCELFVPWSDGTETRAMIFYMKKDLPRTQSATSKDKLDEPFKRYAMMQTGIQNYVRLEVRRFQGEVETVALEDERTWHYIADLIDDPNEGAQAYINLEYRFKMPNLSPGRSKRVRKEDGNSDCPPSSSSSASSSKRAKLEATPANSEALSDHEDDADTEARLRKMKEALKAAEKEEEKLKNAVQHKLNSLQAKLAATKERTKSLKRLLKD
ncbi:hypothetical protein FB451DRAFT_632389 [Mycena latifolia]|nr:hypothetical protein FB451DRAFT_632389 [Mycena latifolia]